jgi:hypothetical protein
MEAHAKAFSTGEVLRIMKIFNGAATDQRSGWQPALALELALAESLEAPAAPAPVAVPSSEGRTRARVESGTAPKTAAKPTADPSAAKAPPARTGERPAVSAGEVIKVWKEIASSLPREQANLKGLLNSVRMIDVQGKTLILGFASEVLISKMDKPEQIEAAQKAIAEKLGVQLTIRCVVNNAKGKIPSDVPQDGMVATAIQHGGEIVDADE